VARPTFYRDPIHGQLRYDNVDIANTLPSSDGEKRLGWLIRRLIDCPEFQRLRHIRQNGLANLVFHGAEHSRFTHSMGTAHVAREMFDCITRNSDAKPEDEHLLATVAAALLHDVGHGPFSHTLEEILSECGVEFDHERMTQRILEEETQIKSVLAEVDNSFPGTVAAYVDKKKRKTDHWSYRLVSSQLDADRLDYLLRDARFCGLQGHGFDLPRLLDFLTQLDGTRVAVDRRAIEAVEAYLVTLDHMYRAVYFHHTVRAASRLLESLLSRAIELYKNGDSAVLRPGTTDRSPVVELIEKGTGIDLADYLRLGEYHVWGLIDHWQRHPDAVLSDLARRLTERRFPKTVEVPDEKYRELQRLERRAADLTRETLSFVDEKSVRFYVLVDEPERTSYKQYDWRTEEPDESIWIVGMPTPPTPVEKYASSKIVQGLKDTRYFPRLIVIDEVRKKLLV
jgi:HD superfamily phosphohydrolase